MCLIVIALKSHPTYKLILAANRDEYYDRPTASAAFWNEAPRLLAGRDLRAGGTWLGITAEGKIAAVTNYRDPVFSKSHAPSRGKLVSNFLLGQEAPVDYLDGLAQKADEYNKFNIIVGKKDDLYWYSNCGDAALNLAPGLYGLSNHLLDTPWPKVSRAKELLRNLLSKKKAPSAEAIFDILSDRSIPDDQSLPDTGIGLEWERILSPIFITSAIYGTRSSTVLFIDLNDRVTFIERTFNSDPNQAKTLEYKFQIQP